MRWRNTNKLNKRLKQAPIGKLIAFAAVIALGSCNSTVIDGCRIFSPIHGSKLDTAGTQQQVDEHTAKGVGACGWRRMA